MLPQGGILAIDLSPGNEEVVATAGADALVEIFDRSAGRIIAQLSGHSKKVNGALQMHNTLHILCAPLAISPHRRCAGPALVHACCM